MGDLCRQRQLLLPPYFYATRNVHREKPIFEQCLDEISTILLRVCDKVAPCCLGQEVPTAYVKRASKIRKI